MGVYIRDMDKPKGYCIDCPFSYEREDDFKQICERLDRDVSGGIPTDCPLIDIVTCGECKHYAFGSCSKLHLVTDPENFCSDGERRE